MKVSLIMDNLSVKQKRNDGLIISEFYQMFDILWTDQEFGFRGDNKMIC